MLTGQLVVSQLMREMPIKAFSRIVAAHRARHKVKDFSSIAPVFEEAPTF